MLIVTMLGTAATLPRPDRALSSAVFSLDGRHILLDCGEGTQLALHRQRISPMKIDLVALTHYHGDHILGLPGLLQTMDTIGRTAPLYITGPDEGHEAILSAVLTLADELSFPVEFIPLQSKGLPLNDLNAAWPRAAVLTAFPTMHRIPSQGYRLSLSRLRRLYAEKAAALGIPKHLWRELQRGESVLMGEHMIQPESVCGPERPGLTVVFTGDTTPCESISHSAQSADLLIMDATYADEKHADKAAMYGHSTFLQALRLASGADVKRLWLTHYSAMITDPEAALSALGAHHPAAVCAADGMHIRLTFRESEI